MKIERKKGNGASVLESLVNGGQLKKEASIGWFPENKYNNGVFVAQVAAFNEYGKYARPFVRPTIVEKKGKWSTLSNILLKKVFNGELSYENYLEQLSLVIEGDIRTKIKSIQTPPLKESTIMARLAKRSKKSGKKGKEITSTLKKPLIDTKIMINTLTRIVK